jgi:hypothetical protein
LRLGIARQGRRHADADHGEHADSLTEMQPAPR